METFAFIIFQCLISLQLLKFSIAADTITQNQSITDGETLVSSGQVFELGFFSPKASDKLYLGIWYKKLPRIVVWVANREDPITDSHGVLTIGASGDLLILNGSNAVVWSSNSSRAARNSVAQLLDSGNFVLREGTNSNPESCIWQSFDFPTDTQLAGMKLGWSLKSGLNRFLTSWKDVDDPSPGEFTYGVDLIGLPQMVLRKGSEKRYRTGIWNGVRFSGATVGMNPVFKPSFVTITDEVYYEYEATGDWITTRNLLNQSGIPERLVLNNGSSQWAVMYTTWKDNCDDYGRCGANGICRLKSGTICECLEGFVPKSQREWDVHDWSSGCARRTPLDCQRDGFVTLRNVKLPDVVHFWLNQSMDLEGCRAECLKNCSCTAYVNSDIRAGGSGCLIWFGDLIDIREFGDQNGDQDIYIRMASSELNHNGKKTKRLLIIAVASAVSCILALSLLTWCIIRKCRMIRVLETSKKDIELPFFDMVTIANATGKFSSRNVIGEGGFGRVYRGRLKSGQEIAVKRLYIDSGQGPQQFKNEVILISKLQHRNLVRLLGCCIEGKERMLIYEYMQNKSLNYFVFDQSKKVSLTWQKRFEIALGIARGLVYLHRDSRLRIVHRDLKTNNILLDADLNPKISDFGIARSFRGDQIEARTKQIIGTYGYMSPEYALDGKFSVKSDVFSLGVLLLEIVSGKRNRKFHHPDHHHSLLGHAWLLWNEHKALELMDACLENSYVESQVLRCIQVGLLCVQKLAQDRPTMSSVVSMLGNEEVALAQPKEPGFFVERSSIDTAQTSTEDSGGALTTTVLDAR